MKNLEGVRQYIYDKINGRFIKKIDVDPENDEIVEVYVQDIFGRPHWRLCIYMIGLSLEVEVESGHYIGDYEIDFFYNLKKNIKKIADIYHKK